VTAGTDEDGLVGHTAALRLIADTMTDRLSQVKINPNRADDFDPIIVITDEFSNLAVALGQFYKTYKSSKERGEPPTVTDIGILLRTARAVGIHMALGIQRPDTMFIAGESTRQHRVAGGDGAAAVQGSRDHDVQRRRGRHPAAPAGDQGPRDRATARRIVPGNASVLHPARPCTEEQDAALSDHERAILTELHNVDSFWPRRVVQSALRGFDPEDDEQEMSFKTIVNHRSFWRRIGPIWTR